MHQLRERINFLKTFAADKNVAAFVASSKFVVRHVAGNLPKTLGQVIECGPGEGVMTRELLKRMSGHGNLVAIESNKEFVSILKDSGDSRLRALEGRAQDILAYARSNGIDAADLIVASIPFSFLTPTERKQLVRDVYRLLAPKGVFIIFHQYSPLMFATMKRVFGNASLWFEVRNMPPCFIMTARKE